MMPYMSRYSKNHNLVDMFYVLDNCNNYILKRSGREKLNISGDCNHAVSYKK